MDCIFCEIAKGNIPAATIYEDEEFKVIMDRFPSGKGHALILTKQHYLDWFEIDPVVYGRMFQLANQLGPAFEQALDCEGINILQNNGRLAGQTVDHIHLHIIPRYAGDGLSFAWKTQTVTEQELAEVATKIKDAVSIRP